MATITFADHLFAKLPYLYKQLDTYKDTADEGLLERYLRTFGLEIDEEITPQIENYLDQVNPLLANENILSHIAYTLGRPPDFFDDPDKYRKLLSVLVTLYKWKGTAKSYEALFGLFGLGILITENYPEDYIYDSTFTFDSEKIFDHVCISCVEYDIDYWNIEDDCTVPEFGDVDESVLAVFNQILCWIEPINATLNELVHSLNICEGISTEVTETTNFSVLSFDYYYDSSFTYDASPSLATFDETTIVTTTV
jgi:phage tail-like protein